MLSQCVGGEWERRYRRLDADGPYTAYAHTGHGSWVALHKTLGGAPPPPDPPRSVILLLGCALQALE